MAGNNIGMQGGGGGGGGAASSQSPSTNTNQTVGSFLMNMFNMARGGDNSLPTNTITPMYDANYGSGNTTSFNAAPVTPPPPPSTSTVADDMRRFASGGLGIKEPEARAGSGAASTTPSTTPTTSTTPPSSTAQPASNQPNFTNSRQQQTIDMAAMRGLGLENAKIGFDSTPWNQESSAIRSSGNIMADAQAKKGKETASIEQQRQALLQQSQGQLDQLAARQELNSQRIRQDLDDVAANHPALSRDDIVKKWSTGKRVLSGLAVALGEIGGAISGRGGNAAMSILDANLNSELDANRENYSRMVNNIRQKREIDMQDYQFARDNIAQSANLSMKTLDAGIAHANAVYESDSAPAVRQNAIAAAARMQQDKQRLSLQVQQFNSQITQQQTMAMVQVMNNPNRVSVTDDFGNQSVVIASDEKSKEKLQESMIKNQRASMLLRKIDEFTKTKMADRQDIGISNDLHNLMVEYAKARDIKPEDYVPLVKTFGSNAKDFIKVQRDVLASEKQAAINTYSVPLRR